MIMDVRKNNHWRLFLFCIMNRKFLIIVSWMDCDTHVMRDDMNVKDIKRQARWLSCTLLENTLNTLINAEFDAFIGATRYERTNKLTTQGTDKLYIAKQQAEATGRIAKQ